MLGLIGMYAFVEGIEFSLNCTVRPIQSILKPTRVTFNLPINNGLESPQSVAMGEVSIVLLILELNNLVNKLVDGDVMFGVLYLIFHTISIIGIDLNLQLKRPGRTTHASSTSYASQVSTCCTP